MHCEVLELLLRVCLHTGPAFSTAHGEIEEIVAGLGP